VTMLEQLQRGEITDDTPDKKALLIETMKAMVTGAGKRAAKEHFGLTIDKDGNLIYHKAGQELIVTTDAPTEQVKVTTYGEPTPEQQHEKELQKRRHRRYVKQEQRHYTDEHAKAGITLDDLAKARERNRKK
jgi:hypothetical protein